MREFVFLCFLGLTTAAIVNPAYQTSESGYEGAEKDLPTADPVSSDGGDQQAYNSDGAKPSNPDPAPPAPPPPPPPQPPQSDSHLKPGVDGQLPLTDDPSRLPKNIPRPPPPPPNIIRDSPDIKRPIDIPPPPPPPADVAPPAPPPPPALPVEDPASAPEVCPPADDTDNSPPKPPGSYPAPPSGDDSQPPAEPVNEQYQKAEDSNPPGPPVSADGGNQNGYHSFALRAMRRRL